MRIRTRLRIASLLPLCVILLVTGVLWFSNHQTRELVADEQLLDDIRLANFQLNLITQEYLLFGGERLAGQVATAHEAMGKQLARLLDGHEKHAIDVEDYDPFLHSLLEDHRAVANLLPLLQGNGGRQIVAGTLLVKFREMTTKIDQLDDEFDRAITVRQRQTMAAILAILAALGLAAASGLWLLSHRIVFGLEHLARGVEQVGSGDLATQLPEPAPGEDDELASLTHSFIQMHASLQATFRRMDQEVGERQRAEEEARLLLNEQRIILDNIGAGILFLRERKVLWANAFLTRLFGYLPEEVFQQGTEAFYPDEETYRRIGQEAYPALGCGEVYNCQVELRKKNGERLWCNLTGQAIEAAHPEAGSIWIIEDISARKKMEAEQLKTRNLESLGILAGGIAHDFNNLFQGLLGNISLAKLEIPETSKAHAFLAAAEKAYQRGAMLTSQLIGFAAGGSGTRSLLRPESMIRETVASQAAGAPFRLEFDLAGDLWPVRVEVSQLEQALRHLVMNAMEAMPAGGVIRVRAANQVVTPGQPLALSIGKYIEIAIEDHGCGIGAEDLPRIFDPYFSTKPKGSHKGVGLGLSLCHAIVKKHGGTVTVESSPGKGSTFHVYLPAAGEEERGG